jgi:hypothetical protein
MNTYIIYYASCELHEICDFLSDMSGLKYKYFPQILHLNNDSAYVAIICFIISFKEQKKTWVPFPEPQDAKENIWTYMGESCSGKEKIT